MNRFDTVFKPTFSTRLSMNNQSRVRWLAILFFIATLFAAAPSVAAKTEVDQAREKMTKLKKAAAKDAAKLSKDLAKTLKLRLKGAKGDEAKLIREQVQSEFAKKKEEQNDNLQKAIIAITDADYRDPVEIDLNIYDPAAKAFAATVESKSNSKYTVRIPAAEADAAVLREQLKKSKPEGTFKLVADGKAYLVAVDVKAEGKPLAVQVPLVFHPVLSRMMPGGQPSVSFSPNGKYLAIAGGTDIQGCDFEVWDLDQAKKVFALKANAKDKSIAVWPSWVRFNPDNRYMAVGGGYTTPSPVIQSKVYETGTWREVATVKGYNPAFSPDGSSLAAKNKDRTTTLVQVATWRDIRSSTEDNDEASKWSASQEGIASDGYFKIATATRDSLTLQASDAARPAESLPFKTPQPSKPRDASLLRGDYYDSELHAKFSPNGKYLLRTHILDVPLDNERGYKFIVDLWQPLRAKK
ncbi:MAG: PD40 domain-containing protein [Rhizobacter sp.]|nr:PD40 domain-containing protein [Chlorobiales bacterium]